MRLLFVSNLFPDQQEPYRGLDNATVLHALRDRAEIRVLALRPMLPWKRGTWSARAEDAVLRPRFQRVSYIPRIGHRWNHLLYARSMRRAFAEMQRESPFDAVLASWLYPDACAVARLLQGTPTRFVAIAQGTDVHHYLQIPARRAIITRELQRAQAIITRSAALADMLAEAGMPRAQLHPVYNGVDLERFHPPSAAERSEARLALGLPPDAPAILFVGNFLPVKNPALLLSAHAQLVKESGFRETRLVLVGGGPLETAMRAQVSAAGTSDRVIFAGRRDANGVAQAMRAADVLALSSWNEGVPNVILEAFASGLPVTATRVGGIAEVLNSSELGVLTPAGDVPSFARALREILTAKPDFRRISEHGRTFSWERAAAEYTRLIDPAESRP
jgi:teichuronic acid biosynthesis glycosyltransferase TuaC